MNINLDGKMYALLLTQEQAELLGSFRFYHVSGKSPLYSILKDLPVRRNQRFLAEYHPIDQTPIFGDTVPAREEAVPAPPKPSNRGWVVQKRLRPSGGWFRVSALYMSRNRAYKDMRYRESRKVGSEEFRVVPSTVQNGVCTLGRGWYRVECVGRAGQEWMARASSSLRTILRGSYTSAAGAQAAIVVYTPLHLRKNFRVRWVPRSSHVDELRYENVAGPGWNTFN